jgi:hypothetical protein
MNVTNAFSKDEHCANQQSEEDKVDFVRPACVPANDFRSMILNSIARQCLAWRRTGRSSRQKVLSAESQCEVKKHTRDKQNSKDSENKGLFADEFKSVPSKTWHCLLG